MPLRYPPPRPTRAQLAAANAAQRPPSPLAVASMTPAALLQLAAQAMERAHAAALAGSIDPRTTTFTEIADATADARRALQHLQRSDGPPGMFQAGLTPAQLEQARSVWRLIHRLEAAVTGIERADLVALAVEARNTLEQLVAGLGHTRAGDG